MGGWLVWAVCAYEKHALETGKVPTITRIVRRWRHIVVVPMMVGAALATIWWHLIESDR